MSDIKIFVSHRIDIHSELIDNPLYIPVRCGAIFDDQNPMNIAGDDTGDNISERRMSFCEFTVQYWAWKNVEADYYGLCHYRRYLSFADKEYPTDEYNMVHNPIVTPKSKMKFGLLDKLAMEKAIWPQDIVTSQAAAVEKIPTPLGSQKTVADLWRAHHGEFFDEASIDLMFTLVDQLAPEYSQSARDYFASDQHRGYNCYVMKKALFNRLCEFQFPIMFTLEKQIDTTGYTQTMRRTPAFIGEMLYGIFIYHIERIECVQVESRQLVFFNDTRRIQMRLDIALRYTLWGIDRLARGLIDPMLPKGTAGRERLKKAVHFLTPLKSRGVALIQERES